MPVRSYNKVEAKYNVTTDFPSLGLHSAAASGNLGLVEYALGNGQPVNSVLDGVLPLHAACAGGHIHVVKLLIERGADVNAPRLPRRYSNDKNRDTSAPIVGTSGSTPLHFAAANGNTNVVTLLLLHGAHADRPDKHGVTPEMLARQNGWLECAQVLKDWIINKDRDLRERETIVPWDSSTATLHSSRSRDTLSGDTDLSSSPPSHRRRLQVKHSIDTALNMLKSSSSAFEYSKTSSRNVPSTSSPPTSPTKPVLEPYASPDSPTDSGHISPADHESRPPSLPQLLQAAPRCRKASSSNPNSSSLNARRPRSAGTDAEREEEEAQFTFPRTAMGKRLGSKYSLINIFRKAQSDTPSGTSTPDFRPGSSPKQVAAVQGGQNTSSHLYVPSQQTAASNGSSHTHRGSDASSRSQPFSSSPRSVDRRTLPTLDDVAHEEDAQHSSLKMRDNAKSSSSPVSMLGSILRTKDNRDRSGSNGSSYSSQTNRHHISAIKDEATDNRESEPNKGIPRPSILRSHNRSSSSGHGTPVSSSYRALRFEYSLGSIDDTGDAGLPHGLRSVNSAGSLVSIKPQQGEAALISNGGMSTARSDSGPVSAPADVGKFDTRAEDRKPGNASPHAPALYAVSAKLGESRSSSISSSSDSSASLLAENDSEPTVKHPVGFGSPMSDQKGTLEAQVIPVLESDEQASGVVPMSTGSPVDSSGRPAFQIDIRSISSHAQAEALVQQAQKEILEMDEQEILLSEGSPGSNPLSARLAAYGESLALEKKLREELENQKSGSPDINGRDSPSTSPFSARLVPTRSYTDGVVRQLSLDEGSAKRHRRMYMRSPGALDPCLSVETANADSRPVSYVCETINSEMLDSPLICDKQEEDLFDSLLYRASTAPLSAPLLDRSAVEQARTAKLTKMGFAPSEQASRLPPAQTKSFSTLSFKNLMQTFKGKA